LNLDGVLDMARAGRLYPSVILYGSSLEARRDAALAAGRTLLCDVEPAARPCGECRHCRRVAWPQPQAERFHPDFHVLERDLRATTSVEATKGFLRGIAAAPFEARGQVFVLAEAETLSEGAADALLKSLEEPPERSPRHFLLLAGSRLDLPPTLRSRSLAVYLGAPEALDEDVVSAIAADLGRALDAFFAAPSPVYLLTAAAALAQAPGWDDMRSRMPWAVAAAATLRYARRLPGPPAARRALLALAEDLLDSWQWRLRLIPAPRILEGLVARRLAAVL
jgi:hypothetical protein